jgi:hypothetical protein
MRDSSGLLGVDQEIERVHENLFMKLGSSGGTQRLAKRESDGVKSPRGPGLPALLRVHGDQHRGNPLHFDGSLQRDDRPMAERSTCSQEDDVRFPLPHSVCYFGSGLFLDLPHGLGKSHRQVLARSRADRTFGGKSAESLYRKDAVNVLERLRAIIMFVGNGQLVRRCVGRYQTVGSVPFGYERGLALKVNPCGGNDSYAAGFQLPFKGRVRNAKAGNL